MSPSLSPYLSPPQSILSVSYLSFSIRALFLGSWLSLRVLIVANAPARGSLVIPIGKVNCIVSASRSEYLSVSFADVSYWAGSECASVCEWTCCIASCLEKSAFQLQLTLCVGRVWDYLRSELVAALASAPISNKM